jgi:hypothetical protein
MSCKEPNPDFDGPAGGSGSGSSSSGATPTTGPLPMTTSGMDGTGSTSLPVDTTSDTMPLDTSSSGALESTTMAGSSSSGGEEGPLYPPCMLDGDPVCPRPYVECYDFLAPDYTVCTLPCGQDDQCPVPATGDAVPQCAGQGNDQCVLDCSGGATCPDRMECQQVGGMFERCVWPS